MVHNLIARKFGRVNVQITHLDIVQELDNIPHVIDYFVKSPVRKRVLRLLFVDDAAGTVADFAARGGVGQSSAYRELRAMQKIGLVRATRGPSGNMTYSSNPDHPITPVVRRLFHPIVLPDDDRTRDALFTLGAPTFGKEAVVRDVDQALVGGVHLARRDGTLASVLPVVLYKQRDSIDVDRLFALAQEAGECRATGFFLDLTTHLSGDQRFSTWAKLFYDHRRTGVEYLFDSDDRNTLSRMIARRNTPKVARKWNLRGNLGLDAYVSMFKRHAHA